MELTREVRNRRVAIAKDVLAQMDRRDCRLNVVKGAGYVYGCFNVYLGEGDSIQPHLDAIQSGCTVCAKGAMLLSRARLYNAVSAKAILDEDFVADGEGEYACAGNEEIIKSLSDIFDPLTLDRIEAVFECTVYNAGDWEGAEYGSDENRQIAAAANFGYQIADPANRVRICMQSLIDNDGDFILPTHTTGQEVGA